jgi:uncharacterized protein
MTHFQLFLESCWDVMLELSPWLLIGLAISGLLHAFLPKNFIHQNLGKQGFKSILKAVLLGIPLPLCSCSVIPTALGLRKDGASRGASMGFLISTPQTGVDSIAVAIAFFGWPFALYKVLAAFITGIIGGILAGNKDEGFKQLEDNSLNFNHNKTFSQKLKLAYEYAIYELLDMIWFWLLIGIIISGAITTFMPAESVRELSSNHGFLSYFLILLISLPLYVCATSSVPIAAALVSSGLPMGAALIFLMAGPASNIATIGAVAKAFGKKTTIIYLLVIIIGSFTSAWIFDSFYTAPITETQEKHDHSGHLPTFCAILLNLYIIYFAFKSIQHKFQQSNQKGAFTHKLQVSGMTCGGCARKINDELHKIKGITAVRVDHEKGLVDLGGTINLNIVKQSIDNLGFKCEN